MIDQAASRTDNLCRRIDACRICGGDELRPVISLGAQYVAGVFLVEEPPAPLNRPYPLEVVRCASPDGCGLVQLHHSLDPRVLYDHYGYRSGTNEVMRSNLRSIASWAESSVHLRPGDIVLDIGCNDGTLLESYAADGLHLVGFDPSDAAEEALAKGMTVVRDFFSSSAYDETCGGGKAAVVTSIAMFYDLEDPVRFAAEVAHCLRDDGTWILELSYLPLMLERNSFDTICHEHLEYYALRQIEWILGPLGLEIRDVQTNDVNGGSFRMKVMRSGSGTASEVEKSRVAAMRRAEGELSLDEDGIYESFRVRVQEQRERLVNMVSEIRDSGGTIFAYGASTKGNTILQFCGFDSSVIDKAADRNPDKWGRSTLGTNIPIVSEEQARAEQPDYFLVLPWSFFDAFLQREHEFLGRGGRFIVPLPEVQVVADERCRESL